LVNKRGEKERGKGKRVSGKRGVARVRTHKDQIPSTTQQVLPGVKEGEQMTP